MSENPKKPPEDTKEVFKDLERDDENTNIPAPGMWGTGKGKESDTDPAAKETPTTTTDANSEKTGSFDEERKKFWDKIGKLDEDERREKIRKNIKKP